MRRREFLSHLSALVLSQFAYSQEKFGDEQLLSPQIKEIRLTIDDGPRKYMETIIKNLSDSKVVFYLLGENLNSEKKEQVQEAIKRGYVIGNHSYSHPSFSSISLKKAEEEIKKTEELINELYEKTGTKRKHKLFRFPYGDDGFYSSKTSGVHGSKTKQQELKMLLEELGYQTQFWDIDTEDWKHYSSENYKGELEILANCKKAKDNDIVLCHDNKITAEIIVPFFINPEYKLILPEPNSLI